MFILAVYKWCYFHYSKFIIISSTVSWSWQNEALLCKISWGSMPSDPLVWVRWTFPLYEKSIINLCIVTIIVSLLILKFGSYTVLSSSSLIEASKLVIIEAESRSQTPSLQLRHRDVDCVCTIVTTFLPHACMYRCNYATTGYMVKCFIKGQNKPFFSWALVHQSWVWISDCIALRLDNSNCFISAICTEIFYQQKRCHSIIHVHAMRKKSHHMVL